MSCLALLTPAIPAYAAGDMAMLLATLLMTCTSLCADYLYIGTVWNVIDRWCAIVYSLYMLLGLQLHRKISYMKIV